MLNTVIPYTVKEVLTIVAVSFALGSIFGTVMLAKIAELLEKFERKG